MTELSPASAPSLTALDLQKVFSVSERTVTNWVRAKRIRHFRKGRVLRFAPDAVLEFIALNSILPRQGDKVRVSDAGVTQVRELLALAVNQFQPNRQHETSNR